MKTQETKPRQTMNTTFDYNYEAAIEKACKYSDNPEALRKLIARLKIEVGPHTVIPSPWAGDRKLKSLHMIVTIEGMTFPYYGSHVDACFMGEDSSLLGWNRAENEKIKAVREKRKEFKEGLLYSLLCCIGGDYNACNEDMVDLGMNPDSVKDVAKWTEIKDHSRKLRRALRLTREEMESLPQ